MQEHAKFSLAALEQVDEVLGLKDTYSGADFLNESPNIAKGRLWANVFKFTLDLSNYHDAYCAIISNPDEESKYICLRRFIIVLYERGATKVTFTNSVITIFAVVCFKSYRLQIYNIFCCRFFVMANYHYWLS